MSLVSNLRMCWDMETCFSLSLLFLLLPFLLLLLSTNGHFSENKEHDAHLYPATMKTNMVALKEINKAARDAFMREHCNKGRGGPCSMLI